MNLTKEGVSPHPTAPIWYKLLYKHHRSFLGGYNFIKAMNLLGNILTCRVALLESWKSYECHTLSEAIPTHICKIKRNLYTATHNTCTPFRYIVVEFSTAVEETCNVKNVGFLLPRVHVYFGALLYFCCTQERLPKYKTELLCTSFAVCKWSKKYTFF